MHREHTAYNKFAGRSVERLISLSDGIFSVTMTLLVLNLRVPDAAKISSEPELIASLRALIPQLLLYLTSFLTLGIFWIGSQTLLSQIARSDRHYAWLNLAVLVLVTLIPFSTSLLGTFITFRSALFIYWANLFLFGAAVLSTWYYARNAGLIKPDTDSSFHRAFVLRIYISQSLYAVATLLCLVFNTHVSIALILLVQLNYAIGPKLIFRKE